MNLICFRDSIMLLSCLFLSLMCFPAEWMFHLPLDHPRRKVSPGRKQLCKNHIPISSDDLYGAASPYTITQAHKHT